MKTWGRDVCVERAEGCWDGQGKGFINSPKKRGETTPSAKAGGMDPASSYPKYPQHLQQAGGWILHLPALNNLSTCSRQLGSPCFTWKPLEHPRNPRKHHRMMRMG